MSHTTERDPKLFPAAGDALSRDGTTKTVYSANIGRKGVTVHFRMTGESEHPSVTSSLSEWRFWAKKATIEHRADIAGPKNESSLPLNKPSFTRLIAEDIEWLMKQPRSLEREHIKQVLEQSSKLYLGGGEWAASKGSSPGDEK